MSNIALLLLVVVVVICSIILFLCVERFTLAGGPDDLITGTKTEYEDKDAIEVKRGKYDDLTFPAPLSDYFLHDAKVENSVKLYDEDYYLEPIDKIFIYPDISTPVDLTYLLKDDNAPLDPPPRSTAPSNKGSLTTIAWKNPNTPDIHNFTDIQYVLVDSFNVTGVILSGAPTSLEVATMIPVMFEYLASRMPNAQKIIFSFKNFDRCIKETNENCKLEIEKVLKVVYTTLPRISEKLEIFLAETKIPISGSKDHYMVGRDDAYLIKLLLEYSAKGKTCIISNDKFNPDLNLFDKIPKFMLNTYQCGSKIKVIMRGVVPQKDLNYGNLSPEDVTKHYRLEFVLSVNATPPSAIDITTSFDAVYGTKSVYNWVMKGAKSEMINYFKVNCNAGCTNIYFNTDLYAKCISI